MLKIVKPIPNKFSWDPVKVTWELPTLVKEREVEGHFYKVDDQVLPSITTILKEFPSEGLVAWRKAVGDEQAEKTMKISAARGKNLHKYCEAYWKTGIMPWDSMMPDTVMIMKKLVPILDKVSDIRAIELPIFSRVLGIAGTIDLVGNYSGKPAIIDIKSSGGVKPREYLENYFVQVTAYSVMWMEQIGKAYRELILIMGAYDDNEGVVFQETLGHSHLEKLMNIVKEYRRNHSV